MTTILTLLQLTLGALTRTDGRTCAVVDCSSRNTDCRSVARISLVVGTYHRDRLYDIYPLLGLLPPSLPTKPPPCGHLFPDPNQTLTLTGGGADGRDGKKGSPYSITERRVPELISVLGSQPAGDVSHKPGGILPVLSVRPAVTHATLERAATNFAAW